MLLLRSSCVLYSEKERERERMTGKNESFFYRYFLRARELAFIYIALRCNQEVSRVIRDEESRPILIRKFIGLGVKS